MPKPSAIPGLDARTPLRQAAPEILAARLADLRALERDARTLDFERIHDLRVATRRLRAGLAVFCKGAEAGVQPLGRALGAVRDLQVELGWLEGLALSRRERDRVGDPLRARVAQVGKRLNAALDRWAARDLPKVLKTFGSARARGRLGGRWGAARLRDGLNALKPKLKALRNEITPEDTHALRKKMKKLKYEAELFHNAEPQAVRTWTLALSSLQSRLGDMHDADLRCAWLDHNRAASPALRIIARRERAGLRRKLERELESWHRQDRLRRLRQELWD